MAKVSLQSVQGHIDLTHRFLTFLGTLALSPTSMVLNTLKCNHLTALDLKGLIRNSVLERRGLHLQLQKPIYRTAAKVLAVT